jgi:CRP-like cAMP-binding protein
MTHGTRDLLVGLTADAAENVLALGRRINLPGGSVLFQIGDVADTVFLVERGRISLTLPIQVRGQAEDVLIEERRSGQALGWSALIPPHRFTLKASALLDAEVLALPRAALVEHFTANPAVGYTIARNVAEIVGQRLQVFQTMWLREMQRVVQAHAAARPGAA